MPGHRPRRAEPGAVRLVWSWKGRGKVGDQGSDQSALPAEAVPSQVRCQQGNGPRTKPETRREGELVRGKHSSPQSLVVVLLMLVRQWTADQLRDLG